MASGHRKKTVGERKTAKSSPPGDGEVKGRKRGVTYSRPQRQVLLVVSVQEAKWQTQGQSQNQYILGQQELSQEHTTQGPMSHVHLCLEPPTYLRIVTPWSPSDAERSLTPSGTTSWENLPNDHPLAPSAKGWMTCSPRPFALISPITSPQGDFSYQSFPHRWNNDPFDHIMHYRQLMTLDIGNDALLCKVFPASLQGQALSWFHRLPPNSVDNFRDLSEASWDSTCALLDTSRISAPSRT
ncbi:hypothetical protein CK203_001273 [Vitis vinifera]|uniref:Retrotransposon gag domain-containing protein n=1 Tax=Vitis vinifera TaxID=29760 RepID=A0A438KLD1_VITVI|nr:hypothetical protein CK203_001273 [Vitis vinifera]